MDQAGRTERRQLRPRISRIIRAKDAVEGAGDQNVGIGIRLINECKASFFNSGLSCQLRPPSVDLKSLRPPYVDARPRRSCANREDRQLCDPQKAWVC